MNNIFGLIKKTGWEAYGRPLLSSIGLYDNDDLSFGRSSIQFSPMEKRLYENEEIDVWFGKVMLKNGKDWCWYQVWQNKSFLNSEEKSDILFVHGTGVHSGTLAGHARRYLDAGFRLIVPDLISHGYSSGMHVYQRKMKSYTEGLHSVLHDVARRDKINGYFQGNYGQRHKTFMLGLSFGGTVAMHYAMDYPGSLRESIECEENGEIPIDGLIVVGPILGYSRSNIVLPNYLAYLILTLNALGAGCMELTVPHKKCLDKDPKVYKTLIDEDKRSHQGAFRVGHMLCINDAVIDLHQQANKIKHPIFIQQGGQDRVACPQKTVNWIKRISSNDKRMTIYPVCQHVIYRKAKSEEEDLAGRVVCIEDNLTWMLERCSLGKQQTLNKLLLPFPSTPTFVQSFPLSPTHSQFSTDQSTDSSEDMSKYSSGFSTPSISGKSWNSELTNVIGDDEEEEEREFQIIDPSKESYDHPLLNNIHSSTLPTLLKMCPERIYRKQWFLANCLRPFDINTIPNWTKEQFQEANQEALKMTPWSSFTR